MHHPLDPRVIALLKTATGVLRRLKVKYAIGGGIALIVHGVARSTSDVDVFALAKDRARILSALRKAGLIVDGAMEPFHYQAWRLADHDPRIRIDVLFPNAELEKFAVRHPQPVRAWDEDFDAMPPNILAAVKFMSGETKHRQDVRLMLERGVVEARAVYDLLASEDPREATAFARWTKAPKKKPNPRRHPLDKRQ